MELPGYDAWLEKPYTDLARQEAEHGCPSCGGHQRFIDKVERVEECADCGFTFRAYDWDNDREDY